MYFVDQTATLHSKIVRGFTHTHARTHTHTHTYTHTHTHTHTPSLSTKYVHT